MADPSRFPLPHQTVNSLRSQVSSIDQLSNIPVGVFVGQMNNFRPYQLQKLIPLPWNDVQVSRLLKTSP